MTNHIDQDVERTLPLLDELGSVVLAPLLFLILAKVPREGLLAPVAVRGVRNRSERGDGLVLSGVLQELESFALGHVMGRDW